MINSGSAAQNQEPIPMQKVILNLLQEVTKNQNCNDLLPQKDNPNDLFLQKDQNVQSIQNPANLVLPDSVPHVLEQIVQENVVDNRTNDAAVIINDVDSDSIESIFDESLASGDLQNIILLKQNHGVQDYVSDTQKYPLDSISVGDRGSSEHVVEFVSENLLSGAARKDMRNVSKFWADDAPD